MSRQRQLKHTSWHRQSSVNNCLHVGANNAFHNFPIYKIFEDDHLQLALYTIYIVIRMAGHTKFEDDQLQLAFW
jgi:hypothetical protein